MSCGWIRVQVPAGLERLMGWRVAVGDATGGPGDLLAPEGDRTVIVEAELSLPGMQAAARLELPVQVCGGRITTISIPMFGLPLSRFRGAPFVS